MSNKTEPVEEFNVWWCEKCADNKEMTHPDFLAHLQAVHHTDPKGLKGTKSLLMHSDAAKYFDYQWKIKIDGANEELTFINHTRTKRSAEDAMYWEEEE